MFNKKKVNFKEIEKKQPGDKTYYILQKLQYDDGIVNIVQYKIPNRWYKFNPNGRMVIANDIEYTDYHGTIELESLPIFFEYRSGLEFLNDDIRQNGYWELWEMLLKKFGGGKEIYVTIKNGSSQCWDKDLNFKGCFTQYNTGYGFKNCQVDPEPFYKKVLFYKDIARQKIKNILDKAQYEYDAPLRKLEAAKAMYNSYKEKYDKDIEEINKKWSIVL